MYEYVYLCVFVYMCICTCKKMRYIRYMNQESRNFFSQNRLQLS